MAHHPERVTDEPKAFPECNAGLLSQYDPKGDNICSWQPKELKPSTTRDLWSSDFQATDLIRLAKQYYIRPSAFPHEAATHPIDCVIRSRTLNPCGYASELQKNYLDAKNERRKSALKKGQLAQYAASYEELGKVQPCSLLFVQNLMPYLSAPILEYLARKEDAVALKAALSRENVRKRQTKQVDDDLIIRCELNDREKICRLAGQKEFKEALAETTARLKHMHAGDTYINHIRDSEMLQKQQQIQKEILARIDEMTVQDIGSETELSEELSTGNLSWKKQRLFQAFGCKLFYVHLILCSVNHIKHRYLRGRTALTNEQLKATRKDLAGTPILEPSRETFSSYFTDITWEEPDPLADSKTVEHALEDRFVVKVDKNTDSRTGRRNKSPQFKVILTDKKTTWTPYPGLTPGDTNFPQRLEILKGGPKGHYGLFNRNISRGRAKTLASDSERLTPKLEEILQKPARTSQMAGIVEAPRKETQAVVKASTADVAPDHQGAHREDRSDSVMSSSAEGSSVMSSLPDLVPGAVPQANGSGSSLATIEIQGQQVIPVSSAQRESTFKERRKSSSEYKNRFGPGKRIGSSSQRAPEQKRGEPTVETWEDVVAIQPGQRFKGTRKKAQPLWQGLMQSNTGSSPPVTSNNPNTLQGDDTDKTQSDLQSHVNTYHAHEAVNRIRIANIKLKEAKQTAVKHDLDKYNRERIIKYCYKLRALDQLCPLFEHQLEYLEYLRREAAKDPVFVTEETCAWYEELNKEATSLGCRNNPFVIKMLAKIWSFVISDVHLLPYCKSKLCLLTLSLPVFEVCQAHWQGAIKFVLTKILGGTADLFREWVESRGLFVLDSEDSKASSATEINLKEAPSADEIEN